MPQVEIVSKRSENSKLYDMGGGRRALDCNVGAIHYKDNYADAKEQWKDIDLTWEGNKITRAPFELTVDGTKITIRDKKTNQTSVIDLTEIDGKVVSSLSWQFLAGRASISIADKAELNIEVGRGGIRIKRNYLKSCLPINIKAKKTGDLRTLSYGQEVTGDVSI